MGQEEENEEGEKNEIMQPKSLKQRVVEVLFLEGIYDKDMATLSIEMSEFIHQHQEKFINKQLIEVGKTIFVSYCGNRLKVTAKDMLYGSAPV